MFTGIIEELGQIVSFDYDGDAATLRVRAPLAVGDASHGASIAVDGMCLTVTEFDHDSFTAFVMGISLQTGSLGDKRVGDAVNLERAMAAHGRLGGHIVQGHLDGTATILDIRDEGEWRVLRFALADDNAPFVARKGSIAIDGVSLTVSDLATASEPEQWFEVSLIPETLTNTTLGARSIGERVNIETDIVARHVQRMLELEQTKGAE